VLKLTRENKEVSDKNRDVERKLNVCQERLKEYEEILRIKNEECDAKEQNNKFMVSEYDGMKNIISFLE
jgi:hypothetical protein